MRSRMLFLLATCLCAPLWLACESDPGEQNVGEHLVLVDVLSEGPPLAFYLIPDEIWRENGGVDWLNDGAGLDRYDAGRTPKQKLTRRSGAYVVAWRCGETWTTDRLEASMYGTNDIVIGCE